MPYFKKGLFMKYPASYSPSFVGLKIKSCLGVSNFNYLSLKRQVLFTTRGRGVQLKKQQQTVFTTIVTLPHIVITATQFVGYICRHQLNKIMNLNCHCSIVFHIVYNRKCRGLLIRIIWKEEIGFYNTCLGPACVGYLTFPP